MKTRGTSLRKLLHMKYHQCKNHNLKFKILVVHPCWSSYKLEKSNRMAFRASTHTLQSPFIPLAFQQGNTQEKLNFCIVLANNLAALQTVLKSLKYFWTIFCSAEMKITHMYISQWISTDYFIFASSTTGKSQMR